MDAILALPQQLGINQTLWLQLGMFLVVFAILKYLLFEPYFAAFKKRMEKTEGNTEAAEQFVAEAQALEVKFSQQAQKANDTYREIFDKSRGEAMKEYDRVVEEARAKSKNLIEESRKKIAAEMTNAKSQISQEVAGVAQLINNKLIGKDLSA